ncbi:MAG: hypothetical protein J6T98_03815 [Salinivirgaceae bacterium]|nr:hypothetical protein [Salinivirgaceae bacterium]
MKKQLLIYAAAALLATPFFTSCEEKEELPDPKVTIMNEKGVIITGDTIDVKLGSVNKTLIEVWYVGNMNNLRFWRQIDDGEQEILTKINENGYICNGDDLDFASGRSSSNGWGQTNVEVRTAFSKNFVHVGSLVKICTRVDNNTYGEVCYKVIESE